MGPWPPESTGAVVIIFLRAELAGWPCPRAFADSEDRADYFELTYLHEVLHALGMAPACGANQGKYGAHVKDDPLDLMYGDVTYIGGSIKLDVGNDDYYNHGLLNCPDLANSIFLDPLPSNPELPPQWETTVRGQ